MAWWYYVKHWVAPLDLVADHGTFQVYRSLLDPIALLAVAWWGLVVAGLIGLWKSRPHITFLAASGFALLSPTSSIVPLAEMVNEHRPYLPVAVLSLAWMIPLGNLVRRARRHSSGAALMAMLAFAALLAGMARATYERNRVFLNSESYWRDVVEKAPSGRAHCNYGLVFMQRGEFKTALEHFEKALALAPYWHIVHINLAILKRELGHDERAREHFERAVEYDRHTGAARTWRGEDHLKQGRYGEALSDFEAARAKSLQRFRLHQGSATACAGLADVDCCYHHVSRCLTLDREATERGMVAILDPFFRDPAKYQAGIDLLQRLKPEMANAWWIHHNLGTLASRLGQEELASQAFARAEELKGDGGS